MLLSKIFQIHCILQNIDQSSKRNSLQVKHSFLKTKYFKHKVLDQRYLKHKTGKLSYKRIKPVSHHQVNLLPKDLRSYSGNLRRTKHRQTSLRSWRALHPLLKKQSEKKRQINGSFYTSSKEVTKQTFIQNKRNLRAYFNWPEKSVLHSYCGTDI